MMSFNDIFDDNTVLSIASFNEPNDLLSLALTCKRLGSKFGSATSREWRKMIRDAKRQKAGDLRDWSLMEEAARCIMERSLTDEERASLPLLDGENWIGRYNELMLLRRPLSFDQLVGDVVYPSNDKSVMTIRGDCSSMSDHVMRAGKHYATFTVSGVDYAYNISICVLRPIKGWNEKGIL